MVITIDSEKESAAELSNTELSNAEVWALGKELWGSYSSLAGTTYKLLLADTKLAALSFAQLMVLIVLSVFVTIGIWICLVVLFALTLKYVGLSLVGTVLTILLLHIALLLILLLASRNTARGLNLEASKSVLATNMETAANETQLSTQAKRDG